jgi:fibronectin-binding autotransporter adhesin
MLLADEALGSIRAAKTWMGRAAEVSIGAGLCHPYLKWAVVVLFLLQPGAPGANGQNPTTAAIPWLNNIQVNNFWSEGSSIIASDTENGTSNTNWYNLDNWSAYNVSLPGATDNQVVIAGHASPEIDGGVAGALTLQLWIYTIVGNYKVDGGITQGDYLPGIPVTGFGTGVNSVLTVDGGGILNTQSITTGFISENLEYDTFDLSVTLTTPGPTYTGQNYGGFIVTGAVSTVNVGDPLLQNGNLTLGPGSAVNVEDGGTLYVNGMASIDSYSPTVSSFILVNGAGSQADITQLTMGAEGNGAGLGVANGGVVQADSVYLESGLITADGAGSQVTIPDFHIGWVNTNTAVVSSGTIEISNGAVVSVGSLDMISGNISITGSPGDQGVFITPDFYNHEYFDDQGNLVYGSIALFFDGGILQMSGNTSDNPQIYLNPGGGFIDTNGYNLTLSTLTGNEYVSGPGGLTKQGQGTLTLDLPANYTGDTTVSGGTLKFGSANSTGGSVTGDIVDNANVDFAYGQTYTGYISGTGAVQVDASLTLLGLNTFSGGLILDHGGTLTLATSDASVLGVGGLTFNGGTFQFGTGVTTDISPYGLTFNSSGGTIDTNGSNVTFASPLNGSGGLTKAGAGTLTLDGNVATSALTVTNGTLAMAASNLLTNTPSLTLNGGDFNLGSFDQSFGSFTLLSGAFNGTGNLTFNNGATITLDNGTVAANLLGGAALVVNGSVTVTLSGNNTFNGTTTISGGTLLLGNTQALGNSTLIYTTGGGVLSFGSLTSATFGGLTGNQNLSIDGVTLTVGGNNGNGTFSGVLSGAGELVKVGTGTLTLNATDTFTGAMIISGGTLQLGDGNNNGSVAGFVEDVGNLVIDTNAAGQTFSNTMIGAGGLIVNGTGTLLIDGDGSGYSGSTTINAGTLLLGAFDVLGTGSPLIVNAGGALNLGSLSATVGAVTVNGTIENGTLTGTAYAGQSGTVSAVLAGSGALTMAGPGTLLLSDANTYSGGTTITGGTLQLGDGTHNGSVAGGIADDAILSFDTNAAGQSFSGVISGNGGLIVNGAGTLALAGNNSYTGNTTISAGTLLLGNASALGGTSASLVVNAGTLNLGGFAVTKGAVIINGTIQNGTLTGASYTGQSGTVSAVLAGSGALTMQGPGTLLLSGANTYTGNTNVSSGTLELANSNALQNSTLNITGGALNFGSLSSATLGGLSGNQNISLAGIALSVGGDGANTTYSGNLSGGGALSKNGADTLTLTGNNTYTGGTTINAGTLLLGVPALGAASSPLTVNAGSALNLGGFAVTTGAVTINGTIQNGTLTGTAYTGQSGMVSAGLAGSGALTMAGSGTLTLAVNNTYSGGTSFDAGILSLGANSALGTGALAFNGGTLQFGTGITKDISSLGITLASNGGSFDTNGNSVTFASVIVGVGNLTKIGAGTLTLSAANTFTGNTSVSSGTLTLANINALQNSTLNDNTGGGTLSFGSLTTTNLGGLSGNQNISIAGVTLNVGGNGANTTYSGSISGSGGVLTAFVKNGAGTLTLTGNSTYSGLTNINSGTLVVSGAGAALSGGGVVTSNSNLLVANGGLVQTSRISGSGSVTFNGGTLSATGDNTLFVNEGLGAFTIGSGGATIDTGGSFGSGGFKLGVYSPLSGSGGLTVAGYGTLDLEAANSYSGDLLIGSDDFGSSTLEIFDPNALQNATLDFGENGNPGTFNIVTPTTVALGGLAGDGQLTLENTQSSEAVALTVGSNNANTYFDGYLTDNGSTPGGSLTKVGTGTLEIGVDAENDYSGGTTIEAGTLLVDNQYALGAGSLTMNGGTLELGVNFDFSSQEIIFAAGGGTINTNGNSLTFASALTGTGAFTKAGAGTLTLSGTVASSSVSVTGGALALGSSNRLASTANLTLNGGDFSLGAFNQTLGNFTLISGNLDGTGNLTVNSGGAFTLQSGNIFANLTGSGALDMIGNGTVSLNGDDTYSGNTVVSGGTLFLASNTALGSGQLILDGGVLSFAAGVVQPSQLTLGANGSGIDTSGGNLTFNSTLTGNSGLTVTGNNTLTLTGNNSYTGNTTISGGTLELGANGTLPSNSTVIVSANATFDLNGQNTTINGLTGGGNVSLGAGGNLTVSGNTADTFSGNINGTGNLTVTGNDSLTLAGNNTFAGNTTIANGTLQIGNGTNDGSVPGNIADNGTLIITGNGTDQTFSGNLDGSGNLVITGNGTLTLTGNNTFDGNTTIDSGTLAIANTTALGNSTTPIVIGSNTSGTLEFTGNSGNLSQNITVGGSGGGGVDNGGNGTLTLSGNLSKDGTTLVFSGGTIVVSGQISGSSANSDLDDAGANVTLTSQNTYNGPTYIYDGGAIHNGISNALPTDTVLILGESANNTGGTFDLDGFDQTVAGLSSNGTGPNVVTNNGPSGANTLTVAATGTTTFAGVIQDGATAQTAITVNGPGALILSGANTYTGATQVAQGELQINGSLAPGSAVTVSDGAILGGNGSIGGNVALNTGAILAPGNGLGTLTVGNLTWNGSTDGSATMDFILSNSGNVSALLDITGTLAQGGGSAFVFDFEDTGYFNNINVENPNIYTLVDFGTNDGFTVSDFAYEDLGAGLRGNFILNGNDLQIAVVPEPAAWGLVLAGTSLFAAFLRKQKKKITSV